MTDDEDRPLYPLIAFTLAVVEGAVVARFEFATTREEYASREGETQQYVMTPENAVEIGRALMETGQLVMPARGEQLS